MAVAATKPAVPVASTPMRAERLRRALVKQMKDFQALGYGDTEIATATVPSGATFAQVMAPESWANVAPRVAEDPLKTQKDRVGSLIVLRTEDNSFFAWLRINKIVRNNLGGPCGIEVMCIGPCVDTKTGRPMPLDLKTGLAWVDPPEPEAQ